MSRCRLRQNHLVQRQVRDSSPKSGILSLEIFQPLDLVALQLAELLAPAIVCNLRHAYRSDRIRNCVACETSTST